jgi:cell division protein FtsZ
MSFMSHIEAVMPRIAVFGVGGAGGNGVAGLIDEALPNVELIVANTDAQALRGLGVRLQLQLGRMATHGLGAGAWPEVGRAAAQEVIDDIDAALLDVDFCFIAAGMGGGTGTGAAPIFAERARLRGIPTVAVVTRPFEFEGVRRANRAEQGIATLEPLVDAMIVVPNQRLLGIGDLDMTFKSAMIASNGVLADAVGGIAHLLVTPGLKQIGFAELRNVIAGMGRAVIGLGESSDSIDRAVLAAERAMACPLIDDEIAGADKLMISISGGTDMSLMELDAIVATIADQASPDVELAWGASVSETLNGVVRVALIAQGHRPQVRPHACAVRAASPFASVRIPMPVPIPAMAEPHAEMGAAPVAAVQRPANPATVAVAESVAAADSLVNAATSLEAAPKPSPVVGRALDRRDGDLTESLIEPPAGDAPLLDLIDRLLPPKEPERGDPGSTGGAPAPINLQACTMDELWLGDFELEDPRRLSLVDQVAAVFAALFRSMTLRLGFGRHSMLTYRGRRSPLPA